MAEPELVIKVVAMPADTNPDGDMFGGWILSQMDLAAYLHARKFSGKKMVTVAMDNIVFHKPVFIGDCLICYANIINTGRTSITVAVEAMVERKQHGTVEKVTEGKFVCVAIDEGRKPVPIAS